jgi:transposase-like protein
MHYTEEQKAEALQLYKTEGTRAAAKTTGIPRGTIQWWAKTAGVRTERTSKTAAATEAAASEAARTRAEAALKAILLADKLLDILSERVADESDDIPVKDLAIMFGIMADKHRLLTEMDTASDSYAAVDAWLLHLTGAPTDR